MKIAVVDEGLEVDFERTAGAREGVVNEGGVFALNHPDALFDQGVGERVSPNGSAAFETEAFEIEKASRVEGAAGPAVGCQRVRGTGVANGFIEERDQLSAAERRLKGSDEKAVIAARRATADGCGGEATDAVGDQPLAGFGGGEIAADFAPEANW